MSDWGIIAKLNFDPATLVESGDKKARSPDDKECGDHYIKKDLECHDGDAHRPTPGKNPYWTDDGKEKKKSEDKKGSKKSEKKDEPKKKKETKTTPKKFDEAKQYAKERYGHYKDLLTKALKKKGKKTELTEQMHYEIMELTLRDTAREFGLSQKELGLEGKGRRMWRPKKGARSPYLPDRETTMPYDGESPEQVHLPDYFGDKGLYKKATDELTKPGDKAKDKKSEKGGDGVPAPKKAPSRK